MQVKNVRDMTKSLAFEIGNQLKNQYPESAIGLIGCHAAGESNPSCEYDYLIVRDEVQRIERRLIKNNLVDIIFIDKQSIQQNNDYKLILALLDINVISDPNWDIISIVSNIKSNKSKNLNRYAKYSLFKSLSVMGRFNDAINASNILDAGFWLLSSANTFAMAIIALNGKVPRRSHLLQEFRADNITSMNIFELWSEVSGLNLATKVSVTRRLDAIRDVLQTGSTFSASPIFSQHEYAYKIIETKSNYLLKSHSVLDAYCYLGIELTKSVEKLYELRCQNTETVPLFHKMVEQLNVNEKNMKKLDIQTIRLIGINSDEQLLKSQGLNFTNLIKTFAKNISQK